MDIHHTLRRPRELREVVAVMPVLSVTESISVRVDDVGSVYGPRVSLVREGLAYTLRLWSFGRATM